MKVSRFFGPVVLFWAELSGAIRYRFSSSYRRKILESSLVVAMDSADSVYLTEYDYKSLITYEKDLTAKAAFHRVDTLEDIRNFREEATNNSNIFLEVEEDRVDSVIKGEDGNVVKTISFPKNNKEDN